MTTDICILDYSIGDVFLYHFDRELSGEEVEKFLYEEMNFKEDDIYYMVSNRINVYEYNN